MKACRVSISVNGAIYSGGAATITISLKNNLSCTHIIKVFVMLIHYHIKLIMMVTKIQHLS